MFRTALPEHELWDGEMKRVIIGERAILLVKLDGSVHAFEDRCAHLGIPLSEGTFSDGVLTCRAHHYQYDACTGHGLNPRTVKLPRFSTRIHAGMVLVDTDAPPQ